MKRLLGFIMAAGLIVALSNEAFASVPADITIACDFAGGQDCFTGETIFFPAGTYMFTVDSGSWSTQNVGTTNLPVRGWMWSLTIEQGSASYILGDYSYGGASDTNDGVFFPSDPNDPAAVAAAQNAALLNAIAKNPSATVIVGGSGEDLRFFINDPFSRGNGGSVTIAVVPEPVSTFLFLSGGAVLAGRRYWRRKRS